MDWYLVGLEVFILACIFIHTHFSRLWAVKALVTLSASAYASKHWRLIGNSKNKKYQILMSWPIFFKTTQPCFILKSYTFMLYLSSHMRFWYMSHMRKFVFKLEYRG